MMHQMHCQMTLLAIVVMAAHMFTEASTSLSDSTDSLFLTPLLDNGDIQNATEQSRVANDTFHEIPHSHAGFITVDKALGNHLFFWHFPSQVNHSAPLLLWLNRAPGYTSMIELLWEHGPIELNTSTPGVNLTRRNHTWVGPFSVVYVDSQVGVGYSFSDRGEAGYKVTQDGYTADLYNFVLQFFAMFPEYRTRDFYIGGEAYAGKFAPALAHKIHQEKDNETAEINLRGIILGAPLVEPLTQGVEYFKHLYGLGVISSSDLNNYTNELDDFYQKLKQGNLTNLTMKDIAKITLRASEIPLQLLENYISEIDVNYTAVQDAMLTLRAALHVRSNQSFTSLNMTLFNMFGGDFFVSTKSQLAILMDNYKVLIYNGDYDALFNSRMIEAALLSTPWSMQREYNASRRLYWKEDGRLKGYYSQTGQFCRVVVQGAGHKVAHDVPGVALEMVTHFLQNGCIQPKQNVVPSLSTTTNSLFLTPLLDEGDIQAARLRSRVARDNLHDLPPSHAGFITVDKALGNHLFFWHFPSQVNDTAPLLLWLNRSPGCTSMVGLLWEHGPIELNTSTPGVNLTRRNHTWVGPLSVVYVDSQVGVGYSFSDKGEAGYRLTKDGYTADLYNFVLQFFKMFPEYRTREFYIGGQAYAGKFAPALAHKIHQENETETSKIPLSGMILAAPLVDLVTQWAGYFEHLYGLGVISSADLNIYKVELNDLYQKIEGGNLTMMNIIENTFRVTDIPLPSLENYVSQTGVNYTAVQNAMLTLRAALNVGSNQSFNAHNTNLFMMFQGDFLVSTKSQLATLMDNYKVLIYNGDYDVLINSRMIEAALLSTPWSMQREYNESRRLYWREDGRIKGFYSQTGQFCRVVVHGAGHKVAHDVPGVALEMITYFLQDGCIKPKQNDSST